MMCSYLGINIREINIGYSEEMKQQRKRLMATSKKKIADQALMIISGGMPTRGFCYSYSRNSYCCRTRLLQL